MSWGTSYAPLHQLQEAIPPPYVSTPLNSEIHTASREPLRTRTPGPSASLESHLLPLPFVGQQKTQRRRWLAILRATPAALGGTIWSAQMIYFFWYFVTRPALPDGSWPRIGPSYAAFPFISCIGAVRELCFKTISIVVAVLLWTSFGLDYYIGSRSPTGRWWRLAKLVSASISNAFLIALSFSSVDRHHTLHLIFTGHQIIGMCIAKGCDWQLQNALRWHTPKNETLWKIKLAKRIAASVAFRECSQRSRGYVQAG
jgi:hypothetical protein